MMTVWSAVMDASVTSSADRSSASAEQVSEMDVSREHIEVVDGAFGPKPRIRGSRIRVEDILQWHEHQKLSAREIVANFPQLTPGDVYAALAYYWDNKTELDRLIAEGDTSVEEERRKHTSPFQDALTRQRVG
jgi:uncharacterized protein (DUF433 family)